MANTLSVRASWVSIDDTVRESGSERDRNALDLVVLIHGFHNPAGKASKSYDKFRQALNKVSEGGEKDLGAIWEYYWPGDHPSRPISAVTYPIRVGIARTAGELLAREWLAHREPHQRVHIVAHSLGCRVALEAIRTIRKEEEMGRYHGARVQRVFLLAAAVPASLCIESREWFSRPLASSTEHVFYSRKDRVLQGAFPLGQLLVGRESGPAVGRNGQPGGSRWASRTDTGLGHSRYWPSTSVTRKIHDLTRQGARREIPGRQLPAAANSDRPRPPATQELTRRRLRGQGPP